MNFLSLSRVFPTQKQSSAAERIAEFFQLPEHQWIVRDRALLERLANFLCLIPESNLKTILEKRRLLLLFCNQKMSCTFYQYKNREIVLIFPELRTLLLSSQYLQGYAVLAHELGHVALGHSQNQIDPLKAQLEADQFAAELGFGDELYRVLQAEYPSEEIRGRLSLIRRFS